MVNSLRGEVSAKLDGRDYTMCLTLGALASLEGNLGVANLGALANKFSSGTLSADELIKVITAGLLGGGHDCSEDDVARMRADGGASGFVDIAARLLSATFTPPERFINAEKKV